jgi:HK97 family phage major capsid protein
MPPRYHELEQRADALGAQMRTLTDTAVAESREMTSGERDAFFQMLGEQRTLDAEARAQREAEVTELRAAIPAATNKETGDTDTRAADFRAFMQNGEQRASLVAGTAANGGILVPDPAHAPLVEKIRTSNPLLARVAMFNLTGDPSMLLPYKAAHGAVASTNDETGDTDARTEKNAPTFTESTLTAFDYWTDQRATQRYLDTVPGAEADLLAWIYEDLMEQAALDVTNGNGTKKSLGIFANTSGYTTKLSGAAGAIANTAFLQLFFALPAKYRQNAEWAMNGVSLATAAGLTFPGLSDTPLVRFEGSAPTILGKAVLESDSAPAIGAANYPVAFGDWARAYAFGVHKDVTVLRDPYTATPKVRFYAEGRMGGTPWDNQAAVLMKSNNA